MDVSGILCVATRGRRPHGELHRSTSELTVSDRTIDRLGKVHGRTRHHHSYRCGMADARTSRVRERRSLLRLGLLSFYIYFPSGPVYGLWRTLSLSPAPRYRAQSNRRFYRGRSLTLHRARSRHAMNAAEGSKQSRRMRRRKIAHALVQSAAACTLRHLAWHARAGDDPPHGTRPGHMQHREPNSEPSRLRCDNTPVHAWLRCDLRTMYAVRCTRNGCANAPAKVGLRP